MLSNNLLKRGWFVCNDDETRVIDNNELALVKIEESARQHRNAPKEEQTEEFPSEEESEAGFSEGLDALQAESLFQDNSEEPEGEASAIIKAEPAEPVYEGPSPEEIAAKATEEARQIVEEAQAEAEQIKQRAMEAGKQEGFDAGYQEGLEKIKSMEQDLTEREKKLEDSYWNKLEDIEPLLVNTINDVYEHVFKIRFADDKNMILNLVSGALQSIEGSRNFLIHVSPEDYKTVKEERDNLKKGAGEITLEIIEDITLSANECMIETGSGIFDCGLGTQLAELKKELKLLSYQKN